MEASKLKVADEGELVLYSRSGCHLCEDAEAMLGALSVPFRRVEISGDDDLERRYGWDVPVLTRQRAADTLPEVLLKGVFSRTRLQARLGPRP